MEMRVLNVTKAFIWSIFFVFHVLLYVHALVNITIVKLALLFHMEIQHTIKKLFTMNQINAVPFALQNYQDVFNAVMAVHVRNVQQEVI